MMPTETLRVMLDERGVEWKAPASYDGSTKYDTIVDGYWFHEYNGKITVHGLTPEQAIAATLGATDARPTEAESSGTLTAEKVRELMEDNSRQYPSPTDPYVWLTEYDWQAIADELNNAFDSSNCTNSERTNAACKPITYDNGYSIDHLEPGEYHEFWEPACACGNCGELIPMRKFCPNCGSRLEVDDG